MQYTFKNCNPEDSLKSNQQKTDSDKSMVLQPSDFERYTFGWSVSNGWSILLASLGAKEVDPYSLHPVA